MLDTVLFLAYAVAYGALLVWGLAGPAGPRGGATGTPAALPLLVVLALVYDNAVLGTGRYVGEGSVLEGLNVARYWLHALLTPLLVVTAWWVLRRAGVGWARTRAAAVVASALAAALVVLELVTVVSGLSLEARREHGVLSYADTTSSGPPLMVVVVGLVLLVAGFLLWRRTGWVWLLVGSVVMVLVSAVPVPVESGAVTNLGELVLLSTVVAAARRAARGA